MKPKKNLRSRLFSYFLLFSIILISMLWIFQTGFLDQTYRIVRTAQTKKYSSQVVTAIKDNSIEDIKDIVMEQSRDNNISVIIYNMDYQKYTIVTEHNLFNLLGNKFDYKIMEITQKMLDSNEDTYYYSNNMNNASSSFDHKEPEKHSLIAYGVKTTDSNGSNIFVITMADLIPVDSTVEALRFQLIVISVVLIIIAFIISTVVSKILSKPIENLNEKTRILATGNYDIRFDGKGYSEIEQLSDSLNDTAVQLKKADQMTKDLIANVSHDLRTPLTMISGYGEVMRDVPGEATSENIQVIIDEANRLTSLVNNLLDISKLQSGTIGISLTDINVNEMLLAVTNTYQKMTENNGFKFTLDLEDQTYYIRGDRMRLEQVLYNLINNAITHIGEDKEIILRARKNDSKVRIDVIDHGQGISKEDLPMIWQRYYKVDKKHVRPETGSGLGLSIVKTILDLHKSEYGVESEIGKGSDFWFEIPLADIEE